MSLKIKKLLLPDYKDLKVLRELNKEEIINIDKKYNLNKFFIFKRKVKNVILYILKNTGLLSLIKISIPRSLKSVHWKYENIAGLYVKLHKKSKKLKYIAINEKNKIIECEGLITPYYAECLNRLHKLYKLNSILEVGAGELTTLDALIQKLKKKPKKIGAIDISFKRLLEGKKFIKKKNKINLLARADASKLPFSDNSFDMVYTANCLEQVPELFLKSVSELVRVSSGIVVIIEPSFEFGSNSSKNYIFKKGYTKINANHFKKLNFKLIYRDILEFRYYIAGTEIIILKKKKNNNKNKTKTKTNFICPTTHENLFQKKNYLSNKSKSINYPVKDSISMLCAEDKI
jgi:ubiquinone/menaquinone biosynthesis C-methylase UbiE